MQASPADSVRLLKLTIYWSRAIGTAQTFETLFEPNSLERIGLAVHELGTNAVKHGALSTPKGVVKIRWEQEKSGRPKALLRIIWKEIGGPPVEQPQRQGFGEVVLTKLVPVSLQGTASLEFEPEGVKWVLVAPSSSLLA
jgi:two-component sensor histidine kinase